MTTRMMDSFRAYDVVQYDGIRRPQYLDIHGAEVLLGEEQPDHRHVRRATGLDSLTRTHTKYNIKHTSIGAAILRYDKQRGPFFYASESGDSAPLSSTGLPASSTCSLAVVARPRR